MKASLLSKLETLSERHEEVSALLGDAEIISDQNRFRDLSREYAELENVVRCYGEFAQVKSDLAEAEVMLEDDDPELRDLLFDLGPADDQRASLPPSGALHGTGHGLDDERPGEMDS